MRAKLFDKFLPLLLISGLLLSSLFLVTPTAVQAAPAELTLDFTGLEDLGSGWAYEGWLIENGAPVSTGTFTVDGSGTPSQTHFSVDVDMAAVTAFVLTIEPDPDPDPAPSDTHLLGGDLSGGTAALSVGHMAALGDDFSGASGSYILAAPSDDTGTATYVNGIWWLDPAGAPDPALSLPTLPAGWVYEGWVVDTSGPTPISTGTFTDTAAADSDGAGATGGANPAPPFPGQDFINPMRDLTSGYAAVISIEPSPDNSPAPFTLKPLADGTIDDVGGGTLQPMTNDTSGFPTGTATLGLLTPVDVSLDCTGLEDLGSGWAYEGWLIENGMPVSTGAFTVDASGGFSTEFFRAFVGDLADVGAFVLTIEPSPDPDPAPSATHILGGDVMANMATATVGHMAALGDDFSGASGSYILAAPSDDTGTATYVNGIWWLDPAGAPDPALSLPTLPAGWVYEGWVVDNGGPTPISTGTFTDTAAADSDGAGPAGGANPAPPFPGQDFINPMRDLTSGYAAVISIEPSPDNSPAPFTLKPLADGTIDDVGGGTLQPMTNQSSGFPTCDVSLSVTPTDVSLSGFDGGPSGNSNALLLAAALGSVLALGGLALRRRRFMQ